VAEEVIEGVDTDAKIITINGTLEQNEEYIDEDIDAYFGVGHGGDRVFTVGDLDTFLRTGADEMNMDVMKGKIVYLLSCQTATELGPILSTATVRKHT